MVVALSGGPDSVAMLRALDEIVKSQAVSGQTRLIVAHLNHRLRGAQSDQDEAFVQDLAQSLGLEAVLEAAPEPLHQGGESRWRKARSEFLRRTAQRLDARWIATAAPGHCAGTTAVLSSRGLLFFWPAPVLRGRAVR